MQVNRVVYQIARGTDGLPYIHLVRLQIQKCPGIEAPGHFLSSTRGATPEEGNSVYFKYTPSTAIGKCENLCPARFPQLRQAEPT
jgi:hypothetical protein